MTWAFSRKLKIFLLGILIVLTLLAVSAALLVRYSNELIKVELERRLGRSFSAQKINLHWGECEATGISLRSKEGKEVIRIDSLILKADVMGAFRKEHLISSMVMKGPYIFVEIGRQGNVVQPVLPIEPLPFVVKQLEVIDGSLDYLDGKSRKTPVLTRIRGIHLTAGPIAVPLTNTPTTYTLNAQIQGNQNTGTIRSSGNVTLTTTDMHCKGEIRSLDLTDFKPYFQKDTDVDITRGLLDIDINVTILSRKIRAPGKAILRNLRFKSGSGASGMFMGVPRSLVVTFLKKGNDEIPVNFVVEGDLDNPHFNIRENFAERLAMGIAEKLGITLRRIGESLLDIGTEGTKKGIKKIGKGIKNMFSK